MPLTVEKFGDLLKIVQTGFYIRAAIVAILTYLAARRGLLNTVNTEYQKRVMDRLQKLSEDLYSEFDPSSETFWPKVRAVHEAIEEINDVFERNRDEILAERKYYYGTPVTKECPAAAPTSQSGDFRPAHSRRNSQLLPHHKSCF